jgi:hypothetical protein
MRIFSKEEARKMMKFVKQFLFMLMLVAGMSVAAMAQRGDPPKRPPKENPPVVNPGKGNPQPRETPKGGDKPKKPGGGEAMMKREDLVVTLA